MTALLHSGPAPGPDNGTNLTLVAAAVDGFLRPLTDETTTWSATTTWTGGLRSQTVVRQMDPIPADGPPILGGHDSAPNPIEVLLAALGNCLAAGYVSHATAEGITIRRLQVTVAGRLDPAVMLGLRHGHAGFDSISATASLDCDATDAQVQRLHADVVASSPVGHTLQAAIPVTVDLAGRGRDTHVDV